MREAAPAHASEPELTPSDGLVPGPWAEVELVTPPYSRTMTHGPAAGHQTRSPHRGRNTPGARDGSPDGSRTRADAERRRPGGGRACGRGPARPRRRGREPGGRRGSDRARPRAADRGSAVRDPLVVIGATVGRPLGFLLLVALPLGLLYGTLRPGCGRLVLVPAAWRCR